MTKRPIYVTIIGLFFIAMGAVALAGGILDIYNSLTGHAVRNSIAELLIMCFTRLVGLVAGIFLLKRRNWARWLCLGWMLFHVGLSVLHRKLPEMLMHAALLVALAVFLFLPRANRYFASRV